MNTLELIEKSRPEREYMPGDLFYRGGHVYVYVAINGLGATVVSIKTGTMGIPIRKFAEMKSYLNDPECDFRYLGSCKITVTPEGDNG